jgi:hypothetical protein
MNLVRAVSTEGFGRLKYHREIRERLDSDRQFRPYFEQEKTELPRFYVDLVRKDLGPLWGWLPEGALHHDPNAYLKSEGERPHPAGEVVTAPAPSATGASLDGGELRGLSARQFSPVVAQIEGDRKDQGMCPGEK